MVFEYVLIGIDGPAGPYNFHGSTRDFIQVCADVVRYFTAEVAGKLVEGIMTQEAEKIDFLRIADWNFELSWETEITGGKTIKQQATVRKVA